MARIFKRDSHGRFASRGGGSKEKKSTAYYGKGRKGRKAAKRATYGRKKDGLSIAQQKRRRQRSNRRKKAIAGAATAVGMVGMYAQKAGINNLNDARNAYATIQYRRARRGGT